MFIKRIAKYLRPGDVYLFGGALPRDLSTCSFNLILSVQHENKTVYLHFLKESNFYTTKVRSIESVWVLE